MQNYNDGANADEDEGDDAEDENWDGNKATDAAAPETYA